MAKSVTASKIAKPVGKKAVAKKAVAKKVVAKKTAQPAVKKVVVKKVAGAKKEKYKIKYEDKSIGQPQVLTDIFNAIKALLLPYEKGLMKVHGGTGGQVTLIHHKPVEIAGRKKEEMWFAGLLVQKGYVGFYFMPVYADDKIKDFIKPELLKCLKGKCCFHIKKPDPVIYSQIKESLKLGYDSYKKWGWI